MRTPLPTVPVAVPIREAYGVFLAQYRWEWFVNFTFVENVHPEAALKKWRLWVSKLSRHLYGPRWKKKDLVTWTVAIEYQKRGTLHFHAVVAGVHQANRWDWMEAWTELEANTGWARIYPIKSVERTCRYICKYVSKDGELFFSDCFPNPVKDLLSESGPV